jgi:energy-coupling factor transport system ATP-binding protein
MNKKIELQSVSYVYGERTPFEITALKNVNLNIEAGSVTGIIGHTGSGKSTLVRLLNGLERPASGKVLLDGVDIWEKPKEIGKVRYRVGLVMQYPEYQLFEETVAADIAYGPKNMGLDEEAVEERVKKYAALVGLSEEDLQKSPFELSGGQKRRAAIAGIMAMKPDVLVLDEPAAGLDPVGRNLIFDAIEEYRAVEGATIIIVSHSMEDMAVRCHRVVVMSDGQVVADGTRDEVFSDADKLVSVGLDVPEITKLAALLASRGFDFGKTVYTVEDAADVICRALSGGDGK